MAQRSDSEALLELDGVSKSFRTEDGREIPILRDVDLTVRRGESVAIVGPSGSGKSTLLNLVGTLDAPTAGAVRIDGRDVASLGEKAKAALRAERIGFVFQAHHLLPQCTVLENVLVPTLAKGAGGGGAASSPAERARELLGRVGLGERLEHRPGQLSGGESQRVAVVRALINRPALLLADEPTGSLDHESSRTLSDLLLELQREEDVALVLVTHALDLAERLERTVELRDRTLVEQGAESATGTA